MVLAVLEIPRLQVHHKAITAVQGLPQGVAETQTMAVAVAVAQVQWAARVVVPQAATVGMEPHLPLLVLPSLMQVAVAVVVAHLPVAAVRAVAERAVLAIAPLRGLRTEVEAVEGRVAVLDQGAQAVPAS